MLSDVADQLDEQQHAEQHRATRALRVLDAFLDAHLAHDGSRAATHLGDLMTLVCEGDGDRLAVPRLIGLNMVLVAMTASMLTAPGCDCEGHYYVLRAQVDDEHWMTLPEADQVALAATVAALNGDIDTAQAVVRFHALHGGLWLAVQVLLTLADMYQASTQPPAVNRRPVHDPNPLEGPARGYSDRSDLPG